MLDKEFRRLRQMSLSGVKDDQLLELAQEFKIATIDDFVAAIGYGDISARSAVLKFGADEQQTDDDRILGIPLTSTPAPTGTVRVHGHVDMLTTLGALLQTGGGRRDPRLCHPRQGSHGAPRRLRERPQRRRRRARSSTSSGRPALARSTR